MQYLLRALLATILSLALFACSKQDERTLTIVSSPINKFLESQLTELGRRIGIDVQIIYQQSPAIAREIEKGKAARFDAVWPASSLWIALGDAQGVVRHRQSIMRSPVVFAVTKPRAQQLDWIDKTITMRDIFTAAERGDLRLAVTSPERSNTGASAYLGYLHALADNPEVLTQGHLQTPQVQAQAGRFLSKVHLQLRGSDSLMEAFLRHVNQFDALANYEAFVIEANQRLTAQGRAPLYALYPVDGLTVADSPLAYIDRGDAGQEQAFLALQQALLEDEPQQRMLQHGRRPGRVNVDLDAVDRSLFNPQWGIDLERPLSPMTWPSREVIREALRMLVPE